MAGETFFDLERFVAAQAPVYAAALAELRDGRKRSHWMWFIFPQMRGLGSSAMAQMYGVASIEEARAYLAHPMLGARLRECVEATLTHSDRPLLDIFGSPDDAKFRSSMTLFARAADAGDALFQRTIDRCCGGEVDATTLALLAPESR